MMKAQKTPYDARNVLDNTNTLADSQTCVYEAKKGKLDDVSNNLEELNEAYRRLEEKSVMDEFQINGMQELIDILQEENEMLKKQIVEYKKIIDDFK